MICVSVFMVMGCRSPVHELEFVPYTFTIENAENTCRYLSTSVTNDMLLTIGDLDDGEVEISLSSYFGPKTVRTGERYSFSVGEYRYPLLTPDTDEIITLCSSKRR